MANQIRIKTSVEVVQDNDVDLQGISYSHESLDGNADSRAWGGSYNISTAYTDADVCYWKDVVIDEASSADGLENGNPFEGNVAVTDGTIPATAHVVAVEYTKQVGTVATVSVYINSEVHAALTVGESVVIPLHAGESPANIKLLASAYSDGVNEATVNVMLAGV